MIFLAFRRPAASPSRQAILDAVAGNPGCTKADLCRMTGLSWGAISHHVRNCARAGDLRQHRTDRKVYLYAASVHADQMAHMRLLRDETNVRLLMEIHAHPGVGINALSRSMETSRKIIRRHLADLVDVGVLERSQHYRPRFKVALMPKELPDIVRHQQLDGSDSNLRDVRGVEEPRRSY